MRQKGTVKWFNDSKGFGFITTEERRDVFVQMSPIRMNGFTPLAEGQKVEFNIIELSTGQKIDKRLPRLQIKMREVHEQAV